MKLSKIQKEYLKKGCPECSGRLKPVDDTGSEEVYLWCENCDVSMDSNGGYTK